MKALDNLVTTGGLDVEPAEQAEFAGLVQSGATRLRDAERPDLSLESRFDLVYNAAHAFALAALRFHGYRPRKRYIVFQCLGHTLQLSPAKCRVLDEAHNKRNRIEYEGEFDIDIALVESTLRIVQEVEKLVQGLPRAAQ